MATNEEISSFPEIMRVYEQSELFLRILLSWIKCKQVKPIILHFFERGREKFLLKKQFRLGGWLGQPLFSEVIVPAIDNDLHEHRIIGKIQEDFCPYGLRCAQSMFCWTSRSEVNIAQTNRN